MEISEHPYGKVRQVLGHLHQSIPVTGNTKNQVWMSLKRWRAENSTGVLHLLRWLL